MSNDVDARLAPLMRAAQDGNATSYQALLRGCVPVIAMIARQQGLSPDRVDDVVQETLMTIHRARATYDPRLPFLPWLRAIARRRAIDGLRAHGRSAAREVHDPGAYENHADADVDAGASVDRQDRNSALLAAVSRLPDGQRQAVERLALREQSLEQAAMETGRNKVALKVNLHRGIRALRNRMKPADQDPADQDPADQDDV